MDVMKKNLAIFASGNGSNAENIIKFFQNDPSAEVKLVLSNKPEAYVLERAKNLGVPTFIFSRDDFYQSDVVLSTLLEQKIDWVILAGFLWLIPSNLTRAFPHRIINIHPALLPRYGGKGMYGHHVHKSVIEAGEKCSGISIHYVDEKYDEGKIIFQHECPVLESDTPGTLAARIHQLEHLHFPRVIKSEILKN